MKNRKYSKVLFTALFFLLISLSQTVYSQVQTARYVSMVPNTKGYHEYLPQGYNPSGTQTYPLILFIHGLGELGDGSSANLPRVANNAIPKLIKQGTFPASFTVNGQTHRFIVISPQFVAWPTATDINGVINYLISNYKVDASRIYLTGLSMGGGVTWDYASNGNTAYPKRLAAAIPICGAAYPTPGKGKVIANNNTPVWAFHNNGDPTAPVSYTNDFINYINTSVPAPNPLAKKTIFMVNGHDAWTNAYDPNYREAGKNVYEWMLQYTRSGTTPPPVNTPPVVSAGADKNITLPVNSIQISATASDPGGSVASYAWTKTAGPAQFSFSSTTISNPVISSLVAGTYTFRLTVTDNLGAQAFDAVNVVVSNTTQPPTAGKSIKVNVFGGANSYNNGEWNNWNIGSGAVSNVTSAALKFTDGSTSVIKAAISQSTGVGDNTVSFPGGMAPAEVLRYTSYSTTNRTLTISGLPASGSYNIELYSSRNNTGNSTIFIIGSLRDTVLSSNNSTDKASFTGVAANAQGQIIVSIQRRNTFSYLNGFTISESIATASAARSAAIEQSTIQNNTVDVFPNPVQNRLVLQVNNSQTGKMKVQLFDIKGSVIKEFNFIKGGSVSQTYLSLDGLTPGEYIMKVQVGEWTESKKIIKI